MKQNGYQIILEALRKHAAFIDYNDQTLPKEIKNKYEEGYSQPLKDYLLKKFHSHLKRGDIIGPRSYRNDGVFIFNGKELQSLYFRIDDYGSVPPQFAYPEFPLDYWSKNEIDDNNIKWVNIHSDIGKQIISLQKNGIDKITINGIEWDINSGHRFIRGKGWIKINLPEEKDVIAIDRDTD